MLAETVGGLSAQKNASVTRLQQIERRIEQASLLEDLRSLKTNLGDCLAAVREASVNQQKQSAETIQLVDRESSIATRFGEDVRQSILRFLKQRLKDALLPSDRIVRWIPGLPQADRHGGGCAR